MCRTIGRAMNLKEKAVLFFATGFFVGNVPFAPGTFGTLLGIPLCFLLSKIDFFRAVLFSAIFVMAAIWASHRARQIIKQNDPACIVIDEISGLMITMLGLPFNAVFILLGFIVFRAFDIIKPFPIRYLEKKIPGGAGIVLDDVAAGIFSNLVLRIIFLLKMNAGI